ncbi:MAG: hypothetical protein LPK19_07440 [Hymenobacteraceae bacterium]|nr:hypothetical protein [Hymenobacteraceae bacterium]MDX5396044.1 hypothetical protein [Hymenobacteraceae bacterium]MDX5512105.1 hypothetical protein [Hymenobacteraceae bacterium]
MKLLKFWLSGRPRSWDDLKTLQDQIATIEEQFTGAGDFVFKGCEVTANGSNFDIAPGLVFIDGKLLRFDGTVNVALPIELYADAPVESDSRPDANGNLQNAMVETKAAWRAASSSQNGGGGSSS